MEMNDKKLKIFYMARVSTPGQKDNGKGLEDQEFLLNDFNERNEYEMVGFISEVKSGKNMNRKKLRAFLNALKKGEIQPDVFMCTKMCRLARNQRDARTIDDILAKHDVAFWTLERKYTRKTVKGRREFIEDAHRAEIENLNRGQLTQESMNVRAGQGELTHRAPIGYLRIIKLPKDNRAEHYAAFRKQKKENETIIHPEMGKLAFEAFTRFASGFEEAKPLWKDLRKKGWTGEEKNFRNTLSNEFYTGKVKFKDLDGNVLWGPGKHPALISEETFLQVQNQLSRTKKKCKFIGARTIEYPFRGRLSCKKCESMLTGSAPKGRKKRYQYYNSQPGLCECKFWIPTSDIHGQFNDELTKMVVSPIIKKLYRNILKDTFHIEEVTREHRIAKIRILKEKLHEERMSAIQMRVAHEIEKEDYDMLVGKNKQESEALEVEMNELIKIPPAIDEYLCYNKPFLSDMLNFFWKCDANTMIEILDIILKNGIQVNEMKKIEYTVDNKFALALQPF